MAQPAWLVRTGAGPGLIYVLLTHHIISANHSPALRQAAPSLARQISGVNDSRMDPGVFLPAINKCDVKSNLRVPKKIITPQEVKKIKRCTWRVLCWRAQPGFEPGTSRTRSANHTPRPLSQAEETAAFLWTNFLCLLNFGKILLCLVSTPKQPQLLT